jgi:PAS domain S-box-containing protein
MPVSFKLRPMAFSKAPWTRVGGRATEARAFTFWPLQRRTTSGGSRRLLQRAAAQLGLGTATLAMATVACFQLDFGLGRVTLVYVTVLSLVSLLGSFAASMVLTAVAAVCLAYFFRPPFFPFGAAGEGDLVSIAIFVTTALIVTALTTRLVRTELQLSENTARLEDAQRIAHIGWWERDLATGGITLSDEACRIFGVMATDEPLAGEQLLKVVHPEDWGKVVEARAAAELPGSSRYEVDYRVVHPDGSIRFVHSEGDVVRDKSGRALQMFGVLQDITRLKEADEQGRRMRQLETDLAHLNRVSVIGELTATLAHEILHPIAAARNNARAGMRFLQFSPPNLAEVHEALDCVVKDADRARDIVSRIREHIKKAPPREDRVDINKAIADVIGMAAPAAEKNRVSIRTDFQPDEAVVFGDLVQLQQVVLNLVMNAVEAMSSNTDLRRELSISTQATEDGRILVAVRDSGPGILAEDLDEIFKPFHTTKTSGIGMGLSICRSIIAAHGGKLWAEANQPAGAALQFTLPAVAPLAPTPPAAGHCAGNEGVK